MERALVVGGNGYIGRHVCRALLHAGYRVRVLDITMPANPEPGMEYTLGSYADPAVIDNTLLGCNLLVHLGWTTLPASSNKAPLADASDNIIGSLRLFEAAVANNVRRILFASSGGTVYGQPEKLPITEDHPQNPTCAYGISKLAVEKYLRLFRNLHGVETCSLRIANPVGPGQDPHRPQGAVTVFAYHALHGEPIEIWGDGSVVRDFVHVRDVAAAVIAAAQATELPAECNIGSGLGTSLNQLLENIETLSGKPINRNSRHARTFDVAASVLDIQQAKTALGWQPTIALAEGIIEILAEIASYSR